MGCETKGKIKGFVKHEDVLNYIRQKWDINATDGVEKNAILPTLEYGFIDFKCSGENRNLFYYSESTETTMLSLGYWGNSIEIIKDIVVHFGGGWIDDNDCDEEEFYSVEG